MKLYQAPNDLSNMKIANGLRRVSGTRKKRSLKVRNKNRWLRVQIQAGGNWSGNVQHRVGVVTCWLVRMAFLPCPDAVRLTVIDPDPWADRRFQPEEDADISHLTDGDECYDVQYRSFRTFEGNVFSTTTNCLMPLIEAVTNIQYLWWSFCWRYQLSSNGPGLVCI